MSNTIAYLTSRANFLQVSPEIPITKQRNPEKYDQPDVFEGMHTETVWLMHLTWFKLQPTRKKWSQIWLWKQSK